MSPMWGHEPDPTPHNSTQGRYCHACDINWPNNVQGFFACQVCGAATKVNGDELTFDSSGEAWAYAATEKNRRARWRAFDAYCSSRAAQRDWWLAEYANRELATWVIDADLAAQFAKLREHPTKEVTDG